MDPRRVPRTVSDPKFRQVGFSRHSPHGPPSSLLHASHAADSSIPSGSYNPSEFISPTAVTDFSEDHISPTWGVRGSSGKFATSLPAGGFEMAAVKQNSVANSHHDVTDGGANVETRKEQRSAGGKPLKEKTSKAERRATQEAQRAAKASAKDEEMTLTTKLESEDHDTNSIGLDEADTRSFKSSGKPKMSAKQKKKRRLLGKESSHDDLFEKKGNVAGYEVDQMSSGDEDYFKGMKKWVMQYHQSRPGIKVLQEMIDDFITAHEAQEEQARKEREAQAAEGGWTVVVHHKGRKKTTEAESGIAVGSVAQAAVLDMMAKKKSKDVGLDFYRFQRREAHRNEIMMLQSKFEQDKKRIQELRAARKFRPY